MNIDDRALCREIFEDKYVEKHKTELVEAIKYSTLSKYAVRQEKVYYRYFKMWEYKTK